MAQAGFVYSDQFLGYRFNRAHPLQQVRLLMNYRLLDSYGVFEQGECELISPTSATQDDLLLVHSQNYVGVLRDLSGGVSVPDEAAFGFGPGDNPAFPGMFNATLLYVGATKEATRRIIARENRYVFNNSGGLHHAMPARATGFCLANDCALACRWLTDAGYRVAYIDIDAHHGDGVQTMFYSDPSVLTISLHETPETLFPRVSGFVGERGDGLGTGYNVNIPMLAQSTDEHYQFAFDEIVNPAISAFKPTAVVLQVGADGHYEDPLAHLALTSHGWLSMVKQVVAYGLPIVALGGGGYNLKTVPRLWTLLMAELSGMELPDQVPSAFAKEYGVGKLHDNTVPSISQNVREVCWKSIRQIADYQQKTPPILG
jgi:acetoin utilization protein AcuC